MSTLLVSGAGVKDRIEGLADEYCSGRPRTVSDDQVATTMVPFSRPVDIELKTWWEYGLSVGVAVPPIGAPAADHEVTSTIAAGREQAGGDALIMRFLRNMRYQVGRRVDRIRHIGAARSVQQDSGTLHPAMIRLIEEAQ